MNDGWYTNGEVRWVPLSALQSHRKKLQQRWFRDRIDIHGHVAGADEEWRDVPTVTA